MHPSSGTAAASKRLFLTMTRNVERGWFQRTRVRFSLERQTWKIHELLLVVGGATIGSALSVVHHGGMSATGLLGNGKAGKSHPARRVLDATTIGAFE